MGINNYCLERISFFPDKNSDRIRHASMITGKNQLRTELTDLFMDKNNLFDNNLPISEIKEKLSKFGIFPINQASLYYGIDDSSYDCKDWVFNIRGLSHYTLTQSEQLLKKDSKELRCIIKPQIGAVVVYFSGIKSFDIKHWGGNK